MQWKKYDFNFMKIKEGRNAFRILTKPHFYWAEKNGNIWRKMDEKTPNSKKRVRFGVLNLSNNNFEILEVGYGVYIDIERIFNKNNNVDLVLYKDTRQNDVRKMIQVRAKPRLNSVDVYENKHLNYVIESLCR